MSTDGHPVESLPAHDETPETYATDSVAGYLESWWATIKSGELGALPIVVGLVLIVIIFGSLDSNFLQERNFTNILLQLAGTATIAIGVVFVLLIAEIDLSVAFNSAVGGVVMTLLLRPGDPGWPWWAAILAGLLATTAVGLIMGVFITRAGIPSFVVSLAFLLGLSGVVLVLTTQWSTAGTIIIQDDVVSGISNDFLPDLFGWLFGLAVIAGYGFSELSKYNTRRRRNLPFKPMPLIVTQVGALAVITLLAVWYANTDRGVPYAIVILGVFIVFWSFVASRTRFGRHVYAVGGNPEAARRAGIDVARVRVAVFMISGFMAGAGGIILASRLRSVSTNTGGGNLLLNVIAAAVIGGTSLFGGQGRVVSALLGALVVIGVTNGMDLLGLSSGYKFIITGAVLLAAVLVDSFSKQRRAASGVR